MPSLYSVDISDLAVPVKKEKKSRAKKSNPETESNVSEEQMPVPKQKKPATEKQLAALAKAQETRKRKREEKLQAAAEQAKTLEQETAKVAAEEEAKALKKQAANEKRRLAREKKKELSTSGSVGKPESVSSLDKELNAAVDALLPPKRQKKEKKQRDESEPPVWFKSFVKGFKREEEKLGTTKRPSKTVNEEAEVHAQEKWKDGLVRDRVRNEVDGHMNRMFNMIFSNRRMH